MNIRRVLTGLCALAIAGAVSMTAVVTAGADVINFDDLVGQAAVPSGYGGVSDWGQWNYYDWSQPPYNPNSPPTRCYNLGDGHFTFANPVVLDGAYFAGYGSSNGFSPIHWELYYQNSLVFTSGTLDLDGSGTPTYLATGYSGPVDKVVAFGSFGYFVIDDITFHQAGGYFLSVSGQCPGAVTVSWNGATPNAQQAIVFGQNLGSTVIPNNYPCSGTTLGIAGGVMQIGNYIGTGANGSGSVNGNAGAFACDHYLQLVEGGSCNTSNVAQIP